jgi:ubiquinone/menaquinone biosynthesis C-methylase UbiE
MPEDQAVNEPSKTSVLEFDRIVAEHGEWTAMPIHLGGDRYTRSPAPDWRLRRILQVVTDLSGKPLAEMRVLDLACLEGHYGIEFALHGANVVGMEIREANLVKARYAKQELGLENIEFLQEDVRNLRRTEHGAFDVVICSGILYHLDVPDVFEFVQRLREVCDGLMVIDTYISLSAREKVEYKGKTYSGAWYREHDPRADTETKYRDYWASIDNTRSFWFTHASLCNLISDAGFTSLLRVENPVMPQTAEDRVTYVAIAGQRAAVLSSPPTARLDEGRLPEHYPKPWYLVQDRGDSMFRFFKAVLPQPVKNMVKAALRAARLMPPDSTPEFLKPRRGDRGHRPNSLAASDTFRPIGKQ